MYDVGNRVDINAFWSLTNRLLLVDVHCLQRRRLLPAVLLLQHRFRCCKVLDQLRFSPRMDLL